MLFSKEKNNYLELLSPASNLKQMNYVFKYGADAIYAGISKYSLRVKNNNFNYKTLNQAIKIAHKLNKKIFCTINIFTHNNKINSLFNKDLEKILSLNPDALIVSDPGIIFLILNKNSNIPIHLSVQANTLNWASIKFWQNIGIKRIILPRELSLKEIEEIKNKVPEIELEVFIHGSLCIAYSGKCLLSSYLEYRDANQGMCSNICRRKFKINYDKKNFFLEEDEHGSYIINSKDLCTIEIIDKFKKIGINCLKIEGRNKSIYYSIRTINSYKLALKIMNNISKSNYCKIIKAIKNNLLALNKNNYINSYINKSNKYTKLYNKLQNKKYFNQQLVGEFTGKKKKKYIEIKVKNKFDIGDKLEIITPKNNLCIILDKMYDNKFKKISTALGNPYIVWIKLDIDLCIKYGFIIKYIK